MDGGHGRSTLFSVVAIWMLVSIDGWFTLAVFGPTVVIAHIAAAAGAGSSATARQLARRPGG